MTTAEACTLLAQSVRKVSAARADAKAARDEAEVYFLIACRAVSYAHDVAAERDQLRERYHRALDEARQLREAHLAHAERAA